MKKFLALAMTALILMGAGCAPRECLRSHKETVYHPAWTQFIPTGKTIIPIFHGAYSSVEDVCDEYAPENR